MSLKEIEQTEHGCLVGFLAVVGAVILLRIVGITPYELWKAFDTVMQWFIGVDL